MAIRLTIVCDKCDKEIENGKYYHEVTVRMVKHEKYVPFPSTYGFIHTDGIAYPQCSTHIYCSYCFEDLL